MALVDLREVTVAYGTPPLLEAVEFRIAAKERVCLVGRNGAGKSTLLKLILGDLAPDSGQIDRQVGLRIGAMLQEIPESLAGTCEGIVQGGLNLALGAPEDQHHRVEEVISRLGLSGALSFDALSGGQKRRALLARALVGEPDLLLLDEPTNHLDINSIEWLEQFLLRFAGTILFVSHDRLFADKLATRIVDLDNGKLSSWSGRFATYLEQKKAAVDAAAAQQVQFDKKLAQEEIWIRQGVRERRTRNEGRVKALMRMREEARQRRRPQGEVKMHAQRAGRTSKRVARAVEVTFTYDQEPVIQHFSGTVFRGDKIGLIGPNGCGKTTLLKLLLGELAPSSGEVELGSNLEIAYLDQLRGSLDEQKTVIDNLIDAGDQVIVDGRPKHVMTYLQDFLFTPDRAKTPVSVLSGGERHRLLLAKLFTRPSNILVLDEPTNDLDIETLELLEALLVDYSGTLLVVSHDRVFLNHVVTSTLVFEGRGGVVEYAGGYDDWLTQRRRDENPIPSPQSTKPKAKQKRPASTAPRKLTFKEQRELEQLPKQIESLEREQAALHEELADPEFYKHRGEEVAQANDRLAELEREITAAYTRWEQLEAIDTAFKMSRNR